MKNQFIIFLMYYCYILFYIIVMDFNKYSNEQDIR